jgi:hypothetical protein
MPARCGLPWKRERSGQGRVLERQGAARSPMMESLTDTQCRRRSPSSRMDTEGSSKRQRASRHRRVGRDSRKEHRRLRRSRLRPHIGRPRTCCCSLPQRHRARRVKPKTRPSLADGRRTPVSNSRLAKQEAILQIPDILQPTEVTAQPRNALDLPQIKALRKVITARGYPPPSAFFSFAFQAFVPPPKRSLSSNLDVHLGKSTESVTDRNGQC